MCRVLVSIAVAHSIMAWVPAMTSVSQSMQNEYRLPACCRFKAADLRDTVARRQKSWGCALQSLGESITSLPHLAARLQMKNCRRNSNVAELSLNESRSTSASTERSVVSVKYCTYFPGAFWRSGATFATPDLSFCSGPNLLNVPIGVSFGSYLSHVM